MTAVFEDESPREQQWLLNPPSVAAVLVTHNGARWLPQALDAIGAQTHRPGHGVAVDVESKDETPQLLGERFHESAIVQVPTDTGFGAAVRTGLDHLPRTEWIWLLHDDCAPAPDALERLLDEAIAVGADVVGPKVREWPTLRRLLEVGVSVTGTGHRETGLERGEPDQGQHDRPRDVLAVSSAGMLVKREVWDALDGFDPQLPMFFDDVDFGWRVARRGGRVRVVPQAVLFHAEASARVQRPTPRRVHPRPRRDARKGALFTLLSNASRPGFWWQSVRLLVGSLLRFIGLLLVKAPGDARQELSALISVYARPWRVFAARRRRAASATVAPSEVRHLLPSWSVPYRHGIDAMGDVAWGFLRTPDADSSGRRAMVTEYSHVADLDEETGPDRGVIASIRRHPWAVTVALVSFAALIAGWGLIGSGSLSGGALLPAPETSGDWMSAYTASWHSVGLGSDKLGPPYAFVLGFFSLLTFGHPALIVDLFVLGAVPLAALTAHRLARRFLASGWLQAGWALTYAFLVVASGALGQGRIGSLIGLVLAPVVVNAGLSLLQRSALRRGWQEGLRVGLWLSLLTAFVPVAYVLTMGALVVAVGIRGRGREWLALALAAGVPFVALGPWMWERALDPGVWWWEAGLADAGFGALDPTVLELALGQAGGPGSAPVWAAAPLVLIGVIALARVDRRGPVLGAWLIGLVCLAFAVAGAGRTFDVASSGATAPAWVGFAVTCWVAALAAAGAAALDGPPAADSDRRVFVRPVAAVLAAAAVIAPVVMAGWWFVNADDEAVRRGPTSPLPAYLLSAAEQPPYGSIAVIEGTADRGLTYTVHSDDGPRLGDESIMPDVDDYPEFGDLLAGLTSDPTAEDVEALAQSGIGAIYAKPPVGESVMTSLDSAPELAPSGSSTPGSRVWTIELPIDDNRDGDGSALRPWLIAAQLVVLTIVIIVATPGRRSRRRA